jgi:hypothetical protein
MKGTAVAGTIQRLFEGKTQMFVECLHVDYKSARVEVFHDLSLNVKVLLPVLDSALTPLLFPDPSSFVAARAWATSTLRSTIMWQSKRSRVITSTALRSTSLHTSR